MAVTVTLTFTTDEVADLITAGYTNLRLFRGTWAWGKIGLVFDYTSPTYAWALGTGTLVYTYADPSGTADSVYEWGPYSGALGLGPVRPAFEPSLVRGASLLAALGQTIDPTRFVYSHFTSAIAADRACDTAVTEPDGFYDGKYLLLTSGTYKGEWRQVLTWTNIVGLWQLARFLSGTPSNTEEYMILPFNPDSGLRALQQAIADQWPQRFRRIEDLSLAAVSGEQVYDIPAPLEVVEAVKCLPGDSSAVAVELDFEAIAGDRFQLFGPLPSEASELRVTGRAPFSIPYHLESVVEMAHPRETGGVLARAEYYLRSDPASGLAADPDRIARLGALIGEADRKTRGTQTVSVKQAVW